MEFTIIGIVLILLIALAWWLLIETEGVYLGRRVVVFLYDIYANRYDKIKVFQPEYEHWLIARPILGLTAPQQDPLLLDVATGTGRVPATMMETPLYEGNVVALDLSRRMLQIAADKLKPYEDRISLIWGPAEELPFPDNLFDVVTCLESLEFISNPEQALQEMVRVLRPGGVLLISNRINTRLMPGRLWSEQELCDLLVSYGITHVETEPWQMDYQKFWGMKSGESEPTGTRPLNAMLYCPRCPDHLLIEREGEWFCTGCKAWTKVGDDGVIELAPLYQRQL